MSCTVSKLVDVTPRRDALDLSGFAVSTALDEVLLSTFVNCNALVKHAMVLYSGQDIIQKYVSHTIETKNTQFPPMGETDLCVPRFTSSDCHHLRFRTESVIGLSAT